MSQPPNPTTEQPAAGDNRSGLETALEALTGFEGRVAAQVLAGQVQVMGLLASLAIEKLAAIASINAAKDDALKAINGSGSKFAGTADSASLVRQPYFYVNGQDTDYP